VSDARDPVDAVVVRRVIPVAREKVFAAWLDAKRMARWMCPGDVTTVTAEIDPRVGGKFRIVMAHGRGGTDHWGEFLEIDPPSRLAFTWTSANTDLQASIVAVELIETTSGTEVILTHRRLPASKVDAHHKGWTDIVRRLGEMLVAGPSC
jgi:uncharacterized protein YndB with AHSA1/START domain